VGVSPEPLERRAVLDQRLHNVAVILQRSHEQRRVAVTVIRFLVDPCLALEQRPHEIAVALSAAMCSAVQPSLTFSLIAALCLSSVCATSQWPFKAAT
jgi:uncharacterized protein (DUF2062 family)